MSITPKERLFTQISALSTELAHHVNNPLAAVMASMSTVERISRELAAQHANESDRAELEEVLADVTVGLMRISGVVQKLTALSFRLSAAEHMLGSPFEHSDK